ncbi:MAG: DNA-processing protein DprA [Spirochaetales bacterium]|nr:DNA-processing protein DprA [Spirochaetales bacterium]
MDNKDYLAFVFKNLKGLEMRDKISLLTLLEERVSKEISISGVKKCISGHFAKNLKALDAAFKAADREIKAVEKSSVKFISIFSPLYPPLLKEIYDPPFILFYRGLLPASYDRTIGVVGTRYPSGAALTAAFDMGFGFGVNGVRVVSGLALGIDRHAHIGNMAAEMSAIAVLGNGIDQIYPYANRKLAYQMLDDGGVIFSEFGPGVPPSKFTFPKRNRIISGLSAAVVVVQAPKRSGALITADYAAEQGREVYVHDAGLPFPQGTGGLALVEQGAKSVGGPVDVMMDLGWDVEIPVYKTDSLKEAEQHQLLSWELDGRAVNNCGVYYFKR